MVDFKGSHYPNVILYAVFFYVRYAVSYYGRARRYR
ncbi:transposase-like protein [Rhizobium leguminosarum]